MEEIIAKSLTEVRDAILDYARATNRRINDHQAQIDWLRGRLERLEKKDVEND